MRKGNKNERGNHLARWLDFLVGVPICWLLGFLRFRSKKPSKNSVEIIGVMVFGAIGDALLASVILKSLRKNFTGARIILLVSETNKYVIDLIVDYDEFVVIPVKNILKSIPEIRNQRFDILIDTSQWARISALLVYFSKSKYSVGFKTDGQYRHYIYDGFAKHSTLCHELDNFKSLVSLVEKVEHEETSLRSPDYFQKIKYGISKPYVVIHPWASGYKSDFREWPFENWKKLVSDITEKNFSVIITGSRKDKENTFSLLDCIGKNDSVYNLVDCLSLKELQDCLVSSSAVVSVNTGVMHLAALSGANVISLNGPTSHLRWGGVGKNVININVEKDDGGGYLNLGFEYPKNPRKIMSLISVDSVFSALSNDFSIFD